jgi:squalene cyclase
MDAAAERLRGLQNPDGGWGATADRPSNTESTALSVLAFAGDEAVRGPGVAWLLAHQRPDGSWPWTEEVEKPSWASSQAVLALADVDREAPAVTRGVAWLLGQEGRGFDWRYRLREFLARRKTIELDGTLTGWPWASDTFSWIEPTAFALLALKSAIPGQRSGRARWRIREAEKMILDRECPGGGWNYGNKRVLEVDEAPYPDTTALALLALQGAGSDELRRRNLEVLDRLVDSTGSGLALSLAALCRQAYGLEAGNLLTRAEERFGDTGFLDDTRVIALTVLAARRPGALRLSSDD